MHPYNSLSFDCFFNIFPYLRIISGGFVSLVSGDFFRGYFAHSKDTLYSAYCVIISRTLKILFCPIVLLLSRALLEFYFVRLFRKTKEKSKSAQDSKYIASCKSARELNKLISSTNEITKGAPDT